MQHMLEEPYKVISMYDMFENSYEVISMHDMLEEIGKYIELNSRHRKRLWRTEDVEMLRDNQWAHSVEGIKLNTVLRFDNRWLRSSVFQNMHSLRLIYIYGWSQKQHEVQVDHIAYLPDEIRYLHWENYPFKSLSSSFNPTNLIVLNLSGSYKLKELWNEDHENLVYLREINVTHCDNLRKIPNLSRAINLKLLKCYWCYSLVELPSLENLVNLREIDVSYCKNLRKIPDLSGAKKLEILNCYGCESLVGLPNLEDLINLREIDVSFCKNLRKISNLSRAINLKFLNCRGCKSLVELPSLNHLASLEKLNLDSCKSLRTIPSLSGALDLKSINCFKCYSLVELPYLNHLASLKKFDFSSCRNLKELDLSYSQIEEVSDSVEHLVRLKSFDMRSSEVKKVSSNISKLESLHRVDLSHFRNITEFPEIPRNSTESVLSGTQIGEQEVLCLDLNIALPSLEEIPKPDVPSPTLRFKSLQFFSISHCESLKLLSEVPPYLRCLDATDCKSLEKVSFTDQILYQLDSLDDDDDDEEVDYDYDYDDYDYDGFFMLFNNCFSLNEDSVDNIETVALLKIGSLAQTWVREYANHPKNKKVICCFPGNKISENKFERHSESCSLILKIAPKPNGCSGRRSLAFAICLVVDIPNLQRVAAFICNYKMTAVGGEEFKSESQVDFKIPVDIEGDHVFILFSQDMITIDKDYEEASFQFHIKCHNFLGEETGTKVKKCGIHVFYVDAE